MRLSEQAINKLRKGASEKNKDAMEELNLVLS
jgi:hypothetical protein